MQSVKIILLFWNLSFMTSCPLPIKHRSYAGCHASGILVIDATVKLINTHLLSLFCQFRRKVNGDVHFDSYFIVLPFWLEFLYQSDTSFRIYILRSDLRIIQKSAVVKGLFEMRAPHFLYIAKPLRRKGFISLPQQPEHKLVCWVGWQGRW